MRVIPIVLRLSEAGAALTGVDSRGGLVGVALVGVPEHQPQIHCGRERDDPGQLPLPGMAGRHLAAHDREEGTAVCVATCQNSASLNLQLHAIFI